MELYGNILWNNATANSQKSVMTVEQEKLDNIIKNLDEAGMNYCYYIKDNVANIAYAKVAVNDSDMRFLRKNPDFQNIEIKKPIKNYIPSTSIIGRTPYREIQNRNYQKLETDLALKVAEELEKYNIPFSGKINSTNTIITIDKANREKFERIIKSVVETRQQYKRKIDNIEKIYSKLAVLSPEKQEILSPLAELCYNKGTNFSEICLQTFDDSEKYKTPQLAELSKIIIDTYSNLDDRQYILADTKALTEFQSRIENDKLFEELIYLKGFTDKQKDSIKKLIDLNIPESVLKLIDYDFSADDILKIAEIMKNRNFMEDLEKHIADIKGYDYISVSRQLKNNTYMSDNAIFERYKYSVDDYSVYKFDKGSLFDIPIVVDKGLLNRLADYGIKPKSEDEDKIIFETNGKEWNRIIIPDRFGNKTNSIDMSEIFTSDELQIAENIINDVQRLDKEKSVSVTVQNTISNETITSDKPETKVLDEPVKHRRPTITCEWSESSVFEDGKTYTVSEFDRIMKQADDDWIRQRQYETDTYGNDTNKIYEAYKKGEIKEVHQGYAKTKFNVNMPDGTVHTFRQDIGDGDGGVIDFLKQYPQYSETVRILEADIEANNQIPTEKTFAEQVDEALQEGNENQFNALKVCNTPQILLDVGCRQLPMLYTQKHLREAVHAKSDNNSHWHGLSKEQIKKMPELLESPVMIFDSLSRNDSIVVCVSDTDEDNLPLVVSVKPNGTGTYELEKIDSNFITSIYGRNNFENYIERIVNQDKMLYCNKEKSQELFRVSGLQLPKCLNNLDFNIIIHQSRNIVNEMAVDKTTETPDKFKTFDKNKGLESSEQISFENIRIDEKTTAENEQNEKTDTVKATSPIQLAYENIKNYRITDDNIGSGTQGQRFQNNIAAIKLLKQLEVENRQADSDEQSVLAKYVGWGGLAEYFKETNPHYQELKDILTEDEYNSARATTLDSFYTSPVIIDSIYSVLKKSGFKGGNILEPSCGVGNFFGKMPDEIQKNSKLYGVEIDSITGRIAKQLYPQANITVKGFEKTNFKNDSFDVAIGNIPFGDFGVSDKDYDKYKLKIHDYFFLKTLDKVKNGGIVAFVTSKGTLDKKDNSFRKLLSDKVDLLGAVRLPNDAFKTAGTEVTSDIIFLKKRQAPPEKVPDWVSIGKNTSGFEINQYFIEHPEMVLGEIVQGNKMYGRNDDTMCVPFENSDLFQLLPEAVGRINAQFSITEKNHIEPIENSTVQVPDNLRNYSFFEYKDNIYTAYDGNIKCLDEEWKKSYTPKNIQRAKDYIAVRDTVRELLSVQQENTPKTEEKIKSLQKQLNTQYDKFYVKYGLMHSKFNNQLFHNDSSYPLMLSLEDKIDKDKLVKKSDIFFKRTIRVPQVIDKVNTAQEALSLSIAEKGKVDIDYMSSLTDLPPKAVINDLKGEIYPVPELSMNDTVTYQTAAEYLSGDIYTKLYSAKSAAKNNDIFRDNVTALEAVIPTPLTAGDIDIECGAMWIPPEIYRQFMYETFKTPDENRSDRPSRFPWQQKHRKNIEIEYSKYTGKWNISNKSVDRSVTVQKTYGAANKNAYNIFESVLNLHTPNITKTIVNSDNPSENITVQDIEATKLVKKKAETIKKEFKEWIFKDPDRRKMLVDMYNKQFNCIRPREFDGSAMTFPGMSASIELHSHQKDAIAHAIHGGNTLFAHCVGAGKTFEMIATAMESKRLGLCSKSLFAVPNHLTEQVGADFMKLYPSADILVATKKDFEKKNRSKLFAKIATGNYDAFIIGHSQLGMIPISPERQERMYKEQIEDITKGISELKAQSGEGFQVKAMERTRKSLQQKLEKLSSSKKDNTMYFEELGIDKLFVDEAHEFKNLMSVTKLQNISGISGVCSQKATDLFMKCRYLDEKTGGNGVVFATGTPVSNSITELHTMMRYLQYDFLCQHDMQNFDNWVSTFGKQKTDYELAPTGDKFKARTRIASYANMPELMSMFKQCADVRTGDSLKLPVPECELHIVNAEPIQLQQDMVQELSARADNVQKSNVDPHEDNMLKITSDGRKVGLDPRLVNPELEDNPNTKLNLCVNNVFKIYKETEAEKLTQIIFCDLGVPKKDTSLQENIEEQSMAETDSLEESGAFCVYDDIKSKLVAMGVAPSEIAFIHSAKTETQKSELFDKVRSGKVRVLLGSTAKMGTGTNVQDRLIALHDLDVPWRPADLEQRKGRMVRQGNINKKVHLYRYVTKGTFDAYSYQLLETKQRFISQIITSKTPARTCSDVDQEALTYSEIKALCTGDQRIKEKLTLDNRVKELQLFKKEYDNTHYELEDKVSAYPDVRAKITDKIEKLQKDFDRCKQIPFGQDGKPVFSMKIKNTVYNDRKEAAEAFKFTCDACYKDRDKLFDIGEMYGFKVCATYDHINECIRGIVKGETEYSTGLGTLPSANINKVEKMIIDVEKHLNETKDKLIQADVDIKSAKEIISKPFEFSEELKDKTERLEELTDELNAEAAKRIQSAAKPQRTQIHYFGKNKILPSKNKSTVFEPQEKTKCRNEVNEL